MFMALTPEKVLRLLSKAQSPEFSYQPIANPCLGQLRKSAKRRKDAQYLDVLYALYLTVVKHGVTYRFTNASGLRAN